MSGPAKSRTTPEERRGWAVALAALLTEKTLDDAARRAGVSTKTLRRWLAHPVFARQYRQERSRIVEHAVARMQQASARAVEALELALTVGMPADRIRAARAILDYSVQGIDLFDVASRLEAVERQLFPDGPHGGK
jgi:hypothetical protein